jgi:hypothetical protein
MFTLQGNEEYSFLAGLPIPSTPDLFEPKPNSLLVEVRANE